MDTVSTQTALSAVNAPWGMHSTTLEYIVSVRVHTHRHTHTFNTYYILFKVVVLNIQYSIHDK